MHRLSIRLPAALLSAALLPAALLAATPAAATPAAGGQPAGDAQESAGEPDKPERPFQDREITAVDVVATPLSDLNLRKDDIPTLLILAQEQPYDLTGLRRCAALAGAVAELDALLGPDIDLSVRKERGPSAGKLAQWFVGRFIPFRGVIRELSGANEQQRRVAQAVEAGAARRSFLKGYGEARNCRYPARAARDADMARLEQTATAKAEAGELARQSEKDARAERKRARKQQKIEDSAAAASQRATAAP